VAKIGKEFLGGEYEGQVEGAADPCKGAKPKQHSHGFEADGAFASYDQEGQQVDEGTYTKVNGRTFTLGEPPVPVRYRIKGDTATFDVVIPDCKNARCRESTASASLRSSREPTGGSSNRSPHGSRFPSSRQKAVAGPHADGFPTRALPALPQSGEARP